MDDADRIKKKKGAQVTRGNDEKNVEFCVMHFHLGVFPTIQIWRIKLTMLILLHYSQTFDNADFE